MRNRFMRACTVLAAGVAVTSVIGLSATAASASTTARPATFGCQQYTDHFCGDQVLPATGNTPLAMDVFQGKVKVGNEVIAYPYSATDGAQDFVMRHFSGNADNSKTFEYAPNGILSGLCVSAPQTVAGTRLILRNCNEGPFQTFIPQGPNAFGNFTWSVEAGNTNLVISDPASGGPRTQLDLGYSIGSSYQEWEFTSGPPLS